MPGTVEQHGKRTDVVGSENHINPRRALDDLLAVLLRQTPADRDLHPRSGCFVRTQLPEMAIQFVVGVLPHRTRVEDDNIRILPFPSRLVSCLLQLTRKSLRVVDIHLAPEGADLKGTSHPDLLGHAGNSALSRVGETFPPPVNTRSLQHIFQSDLTGAREGFCPPAS